MSSSLLSSAPTLSNSPLKAAPLEPHFEPGDRSESRCSEVDLLQHMLEVESSRHRLERYARELSRLAEHSALATREANQVAQSKADLVAMLGHEMRTPLNGILGMAQQLRGRNLEPEAEGYVDVISQAGEGLLALLDSVLDLARLDAGKLELTVAPFDVRRVCQNAVHIVQHAADAKGLTLLCEIAPDVPVEIAGDALRFRQILLNLLGNAIKFSTTGAVRLHAEPASAQAGGQMLRFSVTDNGIGISPEGQARLFQRFSQADSSIASRFGGSGLGLAISKSFVELMGGAIGVVSEPGVGSSFWFTMQAQTCPERPTFPLAVVPRKPSHVPASVQEPRILLVEDNVINQKVALLMFKKLGYTAALAENGRKALQELARKQYDLIFMDCLMPEMDGLQATRAIRQSSEWGATVPIIAITANAFAKDRETCLAAGMSDYLSKPVRESELKEMFDKWLPGSRTGGATLSNASACSVGTAVA